MADGEFPLRRFRLVDVNRAGEREDVTLKYERDRSLD